jgi:hypothetical protein
MIFHTCKSLPFTDSIFELFIEFIKFIAKNIFFSIVKFHAIHNEKCINHSLQFEVLIFIRVIL